MILAISSTSAACSVALMDGEQVIGERHEIVGRGHAEQLVPMIESLLDHRRPDAILIDCGPGSFTGVRVGLAAAHGLAIGWRVPLAGCSSTALIAAPFGRDVAVAMQAGHGELFVQSFRHDPLEAIDDLQSLAPAEAAMKVTASLVAGSAAAALVAGRGHGEAIEALPRAADARLLPERLRSLPPRPIYGRAPDARPPR